MNTPKRQPFSSGGGGKETVFPETWCCQLFQSGFRRHELGKTLAILLVNVYCVKKVITRVKFLTLVRHPGKCVTTFLCPLPADILKAGSLSSYVGQHNVTFHLPVYRDNVIS